MGEMVRNPRKRLATTEREARVYARRQAGATAKEVAQELGLSASYVSALYWSAVRKQGANAVAATRTKRIDFVGQVRRSGLPD